jgi:hypothetical protein
VLSNGGNKYLYIAGAFQYAHAAGEPVVQVGNSLWSGIQFNVTAGSGNGTTATLTYSNPNAFTTTIAGSVIPVGAQVLVTGSSQYAGLQTITASSAGSISFASAATGAQSASANMNYYGSTATLVSPDGTHPALFGHDVIAWNLAGQMLQTLNL